MWSNMLLEKYPYTQLEFVIYLLYRCVFDIKTVPENAQLTERLELQIASPLSTMMRGRS